MIDILLILLDGGFHTAKECGQAVGIAETTAKKYIQNLGTMGVRYERKKGQVRIKNIEAAENILTRMRKKARCSISFKAGVINYENVKALMVMANGEDKEKSQAIKMLMSKLKAKEEHKALVTKLYDKWRNNYIDDII